MKKIITIVATGFEDTELVGTVDILRNNGIQVDLVSIENKNEVIGQNKVATIKTKLVKDVVFKDYDGMFLPGGKGHLIMLENMQLKQEIINFNKSNKFLLAICAAPEVLKSTGILNDKTITSYPGYALVEKNNGNIFEIDGNIITGKNMQATIKFAEVAAKEITNTN